MTQHHYITKIKIKGAAKRILQACQLFPPFLQGFLTLKKILFAQFFIPILLDTTAFKNHLKPIIFNNYT